MEDMHYFIMRRQKSIKLKEIAKYCECSIALLSLYENRKSSMSREKIQKYKEYIVNYKNRI